MDRLDVKIKEYNQHLWNELVKRKPPNQKPTLVFTCNSDDCYTLDEKLKIAALFVIFFHWVNKTKLILRDDLNYFRIK